LSKREYIEFFRHHGFNCFPIPKYPNSYPQPKAADMRYAGARTKQNQVITDEENYGVIPIKGEGTAIIDLDNKELYRLFAENMVKDGYMVIETPNGWHIPVEGLTGNIQKVMLYDYEHQPEKQIIEIQGHGHYVIGCGCEIFDKEKNLFVSYKNIGSNKIWNAKGKDFHWLIDVICTNCDVTAKKRTSRSAYKNMRDRFKEGLLPTKGTSNDYFYNAALQCNTDGLSVVEATENIRIIYEQWKQSDGFSGRPWTNIEKKIADVYENNKKLTEGRPQGGGGDLDRTKIAQKFIQERKFYSNVDTGDIYENTNGFLEKINNSLQRELQQTYPILTEADYKDILFKLRGLAEPIPPTNKNLIVFRNGVFDKTKHTIVETDELADMGFRDYDYLPCHEEHHPKEFLKILFDNIPESEHARMKAGLKAVLDNHLDPRISVIYGQSGVGKSTPLTILASVLGDYAMTVELNQFLDDKFIRAKIDGKRLLVFQDLPKDYKDFTTIKTITGEQKKTERGFMKDMITFDNKLKIWASGNYLAKIPENEKDAMYTRRLSLIHNIRINPYKEDPTLSDRIVKEEGEKIISWILNLPDDECNYEDKETVKKEWEGIASPEIEYLENNWQLSDIESEYSVMKVIKDFQEKYQQVISIEQMLKSLRGQGYVIKNNIIKNIELRPVKKIKDGQNRL